MGNRKQPLQIGSGRLVGCLKWLGLKRWRGNAKTLLPHMFRDTFAVEIYWRESLLTKFPFCSGTRA